MRLKYKLGLAIIVVSIGICLMTYQSYALWVVNLEGKENIVNSGCFKIEFEQINAPIMMNNTYPMSDSKGLTSTPYKFKITNKCSIASKYYVTLNTLTTNQMEGFNLKEKIKFAIHKETESKPSVGINLGEYASDITHINEDTTSFQVENLDESIILATDILNQGEEETYSIYLWYDEVAGNEVMNKKFEGSVNILSTASYKKEKTAVEYIRNIAKTDATNLMVDDTRDNNLRYVGASPNNYIDIGDRDAENNPILWQVIGVMNNIENGTGGKETRVKIVRSESIGEYSWDTSDSSVNSGNGINEWSQSDAMRLLNPKEETDSMGNGLYWESQSGKCYNGIGNAVIDCDFTSTGLSETAKKYIGDAKWYTGSNGSVAYEQILTKQFYEIERSNSSWKTCTSEEACNDTVERKGEWVGKVGLISPSDYGYTLDKSTNDQYSCFNKPLFLWDTAENKECSLNAWIKERVSDPPTKHVLMPYSSSSSYAKVFVFRKDGTIDIATGARSYHLYPTVYLNAEVKITEGDGSIDDPFIVKL